MTNDPPRDAFFPRGFLVLVPPLVLLGLLFVFRGWNVPWGDDVSMCPLFDKLYRSTLTPGDLWESYQGHRIFFPRLLELAFGRVDHWNLNVDIGLVYLLLAADLALLCWLLHDLRPVVSGRTRVILAGLCSLSVFSANQEENWMNGFMLNLSLSVTCVLAGTVLLAKRGATFSTLLACIAAGTVASYSFGNGVTYWLALVPLLSVKLRGDPRWLVKALSWAAAAGVVIFFYFYRLGGGGGSMSLGQSALHVFRVPGTFLTYLFACAGAGAFFLNGAQANLPAAARLLVASGAPLCGLVGLTAFAVTVWRRLRREGQPLPLIAPWLSLASYAILSVGVTSLARYTSAPESAIASRYIAFSQYLWLALFVLLALSAARARRPWFWSLGSALALCYLVSYANGLRHAAAVSAQLRQARQDLVTRPGAATYRTINGDRDPAQVAGFMDMTRRHRLALYRDEPAP